MKKIRKILNKSVSHVIISALLITSSAQAAEGGAEYITSDSFSEIMDIAVNTLGEIGDDISDTIESVFENESDIESDDIEDVKAKSEWDMEDIISMYEEGYDIEDIGTAMELAPQLDVKPFDLLEKKGKPSYEAHALTSEEAVLAEQNRIPYNLENLSEQQYYNVSSVISKEEVSLQENIVWWKQILLW